jgi:rhodanese-related sulfurtransferase
MRHLTLALALFASFFACSTPKPPPPFKRSTIRALLPQEFAKMVNDTHTFVVNVEPAPKGEIPGTKLLVSGAQAFESVKVAQPDVTRPIALYCENGHKSDTLAAQLARAGYSSICVLHGGYRSWLDAGLPFRLYNNQE